MRGVWVRLAAACAVAVLAPACASERATDASSPPARRVGAVTVDYGDYAVRLARDGSLALVGQRDKFAGRRDSARMPAASAEALLAALDRLDFDTLPARYAPGGPRCTVWATDRPWFRLRVEAQGAPPRTVEYSRGCRDAPAALAALSDSMDVAQGHGAWVARIAPERVFRFPGP